MGCPVAYLTGRKEFWSLELAVSPDTLIPRPETEHVVEEALRVIGGLSGVVSVWDVGTGCGNIAVALAATVPRVRVLATDRSPAALAMAAQNARRHGVAGRVRLLAADLDEPLGSGQFNLIVSNPPYVPAAEWAVLPPQVREFEPPEAIWGGEDGLSVIRRLIDVAPARLRLGGSLVFEIGGAIGCAVRGLIARRGELDLVAITPDYAGHDRVVVARRP
jgi:release factor glutamine methyltransferase